MSRLSFRGARVASCAIGTFITIAFGPSTAHAQLAPIWTGFYAGIQGGVTWAEIDTNVGNADTNDGVWGLHAGYNLANGQFVIGVEGDVNFAGATFAGSAPEIGSASAKTDWSGSIRVRAGMTYGPMLLYGTVGYAHLAADYKLESSIYGIRYQDSEDLTGLVYGIGAEGFVLPNVSLRLEALQYDYNVDDEALRPYLEIDPSETVVRAGLTYHFN